MSNSLLRLILISSILHVLAACGGVQTPSNPGAVMTPVAISGSLSALDLCQAIPQAAITAALGRELASPPQRFEYYDTIGSTGCQYDAGKDAEGNALFAYVALAPPAAFDQQPLYRNEEVAGIGNAAYFNNGPDARQLWVRVGDKAALVVAIGDEPDEAALRELATMVVGALH